MSEKAESEKLKAESADGGADVPMRCVVSRAGRPLLEAEFFTDGRRGAVSSLAMEPGEEREAFKGLATLTGCVAAILEAEYQAKEGAGA